MKILLFGATANVSYSFLKKAHEVFQITATYRSNLPEEIEHIEGVKFVKLDNFSSENIRTLIENEKPEVIINAIASGSVDDCEVNQDSAYQINVQFVKTLVDTVKALPVKLIHFSSNAIYDGASAPYSEEDVALPVNYYGECKKDADDYIKEKLKNYLILRPSTIIGKKEAFQRSNPLHFILTMLKEKIPLKLVATDTVNFVGVEDVSEILNRAIAENLSGEYNIGGDESLNRYDFGAFVCQSLGVENNIAKCTYEELNLSAKRGENTSLNNQKIKRDLNFSFTPLKKVILKAAKNK